ncbi:MAG: asparaginase [Chloroflexota bacterium]
MPASSPAPRPGRSGARAGRPAIDAPPVAEVRRAGIVESRHRGHIVVVAADGTVEHALGDPSVPVTLRSAVKPFALLAFVESGAADALRVSDEELAVLAASHAGEDRHVRTLHALLRRAGLTAAQVRCAPAMPTDPATHARLLRDGEGPGPLRHQCSGFHAASLLLARHGDWPLDTYTDPAHPTQKAVRDAVARVFRTTVAKLRIGIDDCGLATYAFPLADVARAYALLADPAVGAGRDRALGLAVPALLRIRDAMRAAPEMVAGVASLDTQLMKRGSGRIVAKGGAEGLRGIGLLAGARGPGTPPAGMALSIEDGDPTGRASRAATVEALAQIRVLGPEELRALGPMHHPAVHGPDGTLAWELVPGFTLAPILELPSRERRG